MALFLSVLVFKSGLYFLKMSRPLLFQVIEITEYRAQLYDYIKNRMLAIAPNLTVLVGELVGARLIAHAGNTGFCFLYVCLCVHLHVCVHLS